MSTWFNRIQLSTGGIAYLLVNYKNEDTDEFLLSISDGSKVWKGKCKNEAIYRDFLLLVKQMYTG